MSHNKNNQEFSKSISLRDKIKNYRRKLHGEVVEVFDKIFCKASDTQNFKEALSGGKNLQKSFVAAKVEVEKILKYK